MDDVPTMKRLCECRWLILGLIHISIGLFFLLWIGIDLSQKESASQWPNHTSRLFLKLFQNNRVLVDRPLKYTSPPLRETKPKETNVFFCFAGDLFGLILYEAEMYTVSETSVGSATGGVCQNEAPSSSLDWWLARGLDTPSADRSNTFITKQ